MSESPAKAWSLSTRLAVWYAGSAFVIVLLATSFLYLHLVRSLETDADLFLADQVQVLRTLLSEHPNDKKALEQEAQWESEARLYTKLWVRVLEPDGTTLVETAGMDRWFPASAFPAATRAGETLRGPAGSHGDAPPFRAIAALGPGAAPGAPGRVIQVAIDREHEEELLSGFRVRLAIVCASSLVICSVAGFLFARRGMRPVELITAAAGRVGSSTLAARIDPAHYPRELATLARTFNAMLERLEESFGRLSRFSDDLAHELRTPVNNLRGELEVALGRARGVDEYRATLHSALEESERLTRIIESLLFLARAESRTDRVRLEAVDLRREIEAIAGFYGASAEEKGVRLALEAGPSPTIALDRVLFQRALGNVLANALRATPESGSISLSIAEANHGARGVAVEVRDTGCGIAPEHLPRVFERFFRADASRAAGSGGTGLGLAIVRSIVELHGGNVAIESEPGRGTRVSLVFPAAAAG